MSRLALRDLVALTGAAIVHLGVWWAAQASAAASPSRAGEASFALAIELEAPVESAPRPALPEPRADAKALPPTRSPAPSPPSDQARDVAPTPHDVAASAGPEPPLDSAPAEAAPLLTDPLGPNDWLAVSGGGAALGERTSRGARGVIGGAARTAVLKPRDFSRSPLAPDLSELVRRNYPTSAKMYGFEGIVEVRAIILSDGTPSAIRIESVDPGGRGFGEACIRTLQHGPKWRPGLNRNGYPIEAEVAFVCPFRL